MLIERTSTPSYSIADTPTPHITAVDSTMKISTNRPDVPSLDVNPTNSENSYPTMRPADGTVSTSETLAQDIASTTSKGDLNFHPTVTKNIVTSIMADGLEQSTPAEGDGESGTDEITAIEILPIVHNGSVSDSNTPLPTFQHHTTQDLKNEMVNTRLAPSGTSSLNTELTLFSPVDRVTTSTLTTESVAQSTSSASVMYVATSTPGIDTGMEGNILKSTPSISAVSDDPVLNSSRESSDVSETASYADGLKTGQDLLQTSKQMHSYINSGPNYILRSSERFSDPSSDIDSLQQSTHGLFRFSSNMESIKTTSGIPTLAASERSEFEGSVISETYDPVPAATSEPKEHVYAGLDTQVPKPHQHLVTSKTGTMDSEKISMSFNYAYEIPRSKTSIGTETTTELLPKSGTLAETSKSAVSTSSTHVSIKGHFSSGEQFSTPDPLELVTTTSQGLYYPLDVVIDEDTNGLPPFATPDYRTTNDISIGVTNHQPGSPKLDGQNTLHLTTDIIGEHDEVKSPKQMTRTSPAKPTYQMKDVQQPQQLTKSLLISPARKSTIPFLSTKMQHTESEPTATVSPMTESHRLTANAKPSILDLSAANSVTTDKFLASSLPNIVANSQVEDGKKDVTALVISGNASLLTSPTFSPLTQTTTQMQWWRWGWFGWLQKKLFAKDSVPAAESNSQVDPNITTVHQEAIIPSATPATKFMSGNPLSANLETSTAQHTEVIVSMGYTAPLKKISTSDTRKQDKEVAMSSSVEPTTLLTVSEQGSGRQSFVSQPDRSGNQTSAKAIDTMNVATTVSEVLTAVVNNIDTAHQDKDDGGFISTTKPVELTTQKSGHDNDGVTKPFNHPLLNETDPTTLSNPYTSQTTSYQRQATDVASPVNTSMENLNYGLEELSTTVLPVSDNTSHNTPEIEQSYTIGSEHNDDDLSSGLLRVTAVTTDRVQISGDENILGSTVKQFITSIKALPLQATPTQQHYNYPSQESSRANSSSSLSHLNALLDIQDEKLETISAHFLETVSRDDHVSTTTDLATPELAMDLTTATTTQGLSENSSISTSKIPPRLTTSELIGDKHSLSSTIVSKSIDIGVDRSSSVVYVTGLDESPASHVSTEGLIHTSTKTLNDEDQVLGHEASTTPKNISVSIADTTTTNSLIEKKIPGPSQQTTSDLLYETSTYSRQGVTTAPHYFNNSRGSSVPTTPDSSFITRNTPYLEEGTKASYSGLDRSDHSMVPPTTTPIQSPAATSQTVTMTQTESLVSEASRDPNSKVHIPETSQPPPLYTSPSTPISLHKNGTSLTPLNKTMQTETEELTKSSLPTTSLQNTDTDEALSTEWIAYTTTSKSIYPTFTDLPTVQPTQSTVFTLKPSLSTLKLIKPASAPHRSMTEENQTTQSSMDNDITEPLNRLLSTPHMPLESKSTPTIIATTREKLHPKRGNVTTAATIQPATTTINSTLSTAKPSKQTHSVHHVSNGSTKKNLSTITPPASLESKSSSTIISTTPITVGLTFKNFTNVTATTPKLKPVVKEASTTTDPVTISKSNNRTNSSKQASSTDSYGSVNNTDWSTKKHIATIIPPTSLEFKSKSPVSTTPIPVGSKFKKLTTVTSSFKPLIDEASTVAERVTTNKPNSPAKSSTVKVLKTSELRTTNTPQTTLKSKPTKPVITIRTVPTQPPTRQVPTQPPRVNGENRSDQNGEWLETERVKQPGYSYGEEKVSKDVQEDDDKADDLSKLSCLLEVEFSYNISFIESLALIDP